jgi:hypothetical protein
MGMAAGFYAFKFKFVKQNKKSTGLDRFELTRQLKTESLNS